ncbi:hypothetical protein MASR2M39_14070 [Ignavibacteriales bacterium]
MRSKNLLIVVSFLAVVFTPSISAQQRHQILFGTYLASSNFPDITFHQIEADNNNIPVAQILAAQNTTNAITATDQYHAQTEELTIALRGTTLNRNMKNDVGSITTINKSGMNNLMKRHGNKFTIKKEPKQTEVITEYSLSQNYPNPFNSSTIIEYTLPKDGLVAIKLYDITGGLVKQLVNEQKPTGRHKTTIESGKLASGIYIYSLRVNDININKKLVILK